MQHGADPSKKNRDGNMALDMVKDGDTDIQDLLRGDAALLDAAKKGCLARVQKLCSPENINCRDTQGRNSTPLHLAGNASQKNGENDLNLQCIHMFLICQLVIITWRWPSISWSTEQMSMLKIKEA